MSYARWDWARSSSATAGLTWLKVLIFWDVWIVLMQHWHWAGAELGNKIEKTNCVTECEDSKKFSGCGGFGGCGGLDGCCGWGGFGGLGGVGDYRSVSFVRVGCWIFST